MESALQDVLGKRGGRSRKCFPVQKLSIDLIWNTRFLVWRIAGSTSLSSVLEKKMVSLSDLRNKLGLMTVSYCFHLLSLTTVSKWRFYFLAGNGWTRLHSQISSSFEKVRNLVYVNLPCSQSRTKWWCIVIWLQTVVLQGLTDCVSLAELL